MVSPSCLWNDYRLYRLVYWGYHDYRLYHSINNNGNNGTGFTAGLPQLGSVDLSPARALAALAALGHGRLDPRYG